MDQTIATYAIALIAIGYALAYQAIVSKFGNPGRVKEIQQLHVDSQKELEKAMKSKNDAQLDAANKKMEAAMPLMGEMFILQFKPMIVVIPLLILVLNAQINLDDKPLMAWPQNASELASLPAAGIAKQMGLPSDGATLSMPNTDTILIHQGGGDIATIARNNATSRAYFIVSGRPEVATGLRNENGVQTVNYPATRVENPFAVQNIFSGYAITLPFSLPIFIQNLDKFPNWRNTFGAVGWYYLCVLIAGLAISLIKSKLDNKSKSSTAGTAPATQTTDK